MVKKLLVALACLALAAALAAQTTIKNSRSVDIKSDYSVDPMWLQLDKPVVLDGGRLLHVASARKVGPQYVHLLDSATFARRTIAITPHSAGAADRAWLEGGYVEHLVRYNSVDGRGVYLWGKRENGATSYAIISQKLGTAEPATIHRLPHCASGKFQSFFLSANDPERNESLVAFTIFDRTSDGLAEQAEVTIYAVSDSAAPRRVASFRTVCKPHDIFAGRGQAMFVEYFEGDDGRVPQGRVIDTRTGSIVTFPIEAVVYGVAFSPDGSRVYAASSILGTVSAYDTKNGRLLARATCGTHGHALGFVGDGILAWLRNDGIFLLRATGDSLSPLSYIANTSLADGFWHLDGSFVENGIAWLKNGGLLWRIEF